MKFSLSLLFVFIFFLVSSCTFRTLEVQTQYITQEYLASTHVGTPDPLQFELLAGQRLLIQWSLGKKEACEKPLFLQIKARFRDHTDKEVWIPLESLRGFYLFKIETEEYIRTKGILTYCVRIQNEHSIIAEWKHPLFVDWIEIGNREELVP